jgi:hypothetical protein
MSANSNCQFALVGKNLSLFLLGVNVSDIDLLQHESMLFWTLALVVCFLKYKVSETGLISVIRYQGSYLVESEVETSPSEGFN